MSDIDDQDYSASGKNPQFKEPTIHRNSLYHLASNPVSKHKRSLSEQLYSIPWGNSHSSRSNNTKKSSPDGSSGRKDQDYGGGESLSGYSTVWPYGSHLPDYDTFGHDFYPYSRTAETQSHQQPEESHQPSGIYIKQAFKRTVRKALSKPRMDDETSAESSDETHVKSSYSSAEESDSKQKTIRSSLIDMFSRMKKSVSQHQEVEVEKPMLWNVTLYLISATFKEKLNCCVHIFYKDKFIVKSEFSKETDNPKWNKEFKFKLKNLDQPLEIQVIQKHTLRNDKLIGRAHIVLKQDDTICSHVAPISYFDKKMKKSLTLGSINIETTIEWGAVDIFDEYDTSEVTSPTDISSPSVKSTRKRDKVKRAVSKFHHHNHHRQLQRNGTENSIKRLINSFQPAGGSYFFSPYETTLQYLQITSSDFSASRTWRPFTDWPGGAPNYLPIVAIQRQNPFRFYELRIPKLSWPIDFFRPMTRLSFPSANIVDNLDIGDSLRQTKIVESGVINLFLVGARGLRPIPQVDIGGLTGKDEKLKALSGNELEGDYSPVVSESPSASAETIAASMVALQWAAKTLTTPPSAQVIFSYGNTELTSNYVKHSHNPDFLEEFGFELTNGSPRFIKVTVMDRELQCGSGGIPRNPILGETVIDLADMPLEISQRLELQLLKNTSEARILLFVTITGLKTTMKFPFKEPDRPIEWAATKFQHTLTHSVSNISLYGIPNDKKLITPEQEEKSTQETIQKDYMQKVSEHFQGFKNSFINLHDVGWLSLKVCSAMGLGGKSPHSRVEVFCDIDYINTRLRTQSVVKGDNATWDRCFVIPLTDIHEILNIRVAETDKKKIEVIGGLAIHPLCVDNGSSKWYGLKTSDLGRPAKGSILLEIHIYFNQFKAALKTLTPKETKYRSLRDSQKDIRIQQLKILQQRLEHVKPLLDLIRWFGHVIDDWWLWKNPLHSILGLVGYELLIYYFQPYFIPLYMTLVLLKNRIYDRRGIDTIVQGLKTNKPAQFASSQEHEIFKYFMEQGTIQQNPNDDTQMKENEEDRFFIENSIQALNDPENFNFNGRNLPELTEEDVQGQDDKPTQSIKKTIKEKYTGARGTMARILDMVEKTASFYERAEGLFHWRISWLSNLAIIILLIITVLLFLMPLKVFFMLWGLNKFTKAVIRPNAVKHNEFLDILSRVPNLVESMALAEYRPDAFTLTPKGKNHRS